MVNETRVVDPKTGGAKGSKLARYDLVPPAAAHALAEHYGRGCAKYTDRNWERGYAWGLSIAALERHFNAWKRGESYDPENGAHHLTAVAWHAFTLFEFERRRLGTDDRGAGCTATPPTAERAMRDCDVSDAPSAREVSEREREGAIATWGREQARRMARARRGVDV